MIKGFKIFLFLVFVTVFSSQIFALDIDEHWKMHIRNDFVLTYNDVWGPGQSNSFLYQGNKGWSYEDRFDFLNRLTVGDVLYEFDTEISLTNNEKLDVEDVSPKKIYFLRNSPSTFFRLGDFFANFSQYSLNQNLKGAIFTLKESETNPWKITALTGAYKTRWEYTWNDESDELKDTYFYGARAEGEIGYLKLNGNYVFTDEYRLDNIPSNTNRSMTEIVHNHLGSIDWRFKPTGGLDLSGESAVSRFRSSNANRDVGFAHKLRARLRVKKLRTQLEYERTPSDFHTPGGSASSDRERYRIRNNYYLGDNDLFLNYTSYFDNTQDTLTTTTKAKMPEIGLNLRNLFARRTLSAMIRLRERRMHQSNSGRDERADTATFSLQDRFGPFRPGLEYECRRINPRKNVNDSGQKTHAVSLRMNSYHRTENWTLRPSVSLRHEETHDYSLSPNRGLNSDWIWSGRLSGNFRRNLRFSTAYNHSYADNYIFDSDSRRRVFRCAADYNLGGSRDNVIGIEYQDRRNSFSQSGSDYNEAIWKFKWSKRF
ncbi:MAG: hypothetical protein KAS99_05545 [Candidatus Omnitrophica bacterium]|nr:hypothetical protein [Candidatus Omnitrophota bacterium]